MLVEKQYTVDKRQLKGRKFFKHYTDVDDIVNVGTVFVVTVLYFIYEAHM